MAGGIESLVMELHHFRGGLADTSTLIYLDRMGLLPLAARCFRLTIIPQVAAEYGSLPAGTVALTAVPAGPADDVLLHTAELLSQPVLSEDRRLLRGAQARNLPHYNTLMLLLALCAQGDLPFAAYDGLRRELLAFARYGPEVVAVGDAVFQALRQSLST